MYPDTFNPLPTPADVERRRETERLLAEVERLRAENERLRNDIVHAAECCDNRLDELRAALRAVESPVRRCEARLEELRGALRAVASPATCTHPRATRVFVPDNRDGWECTLERCTICGKEDLTLDR